MEYRCSANIPSRSSSTWYFRSQRTPSLGCRRSIAIRGRSASYQAANQAFPARSHGLLSLVHRSQEHSNTSAAYRSFARYSKFAGSKCRCLENRKTAIRRALPPEVQFGSPQFAAFAAKHAHLRRRLPERLAFALLGPRCLIFVLCSIPTLRGPGKNLRPMPQRAEKKKVSNSACLSKVNIYVIRRLVARIIHFHHSPIFSFSGDLEREISLSLTRLAAVDMRDLHYDLPFENELFRIYRIYHSLDSDEVAVTAALLRPFNAVYSGLVCNGCRTEMIPTNTLQRKLVRAQKHFRSRRVIDDRAFLSVRGKQPKEDGRKQNQELFHFNIRSLRFRNSTTCLFQYGHVWPPGSWRNS